MWSSPLSIVTSATGPTSGASTRASLNSVSGSDVLPDERGAHAHADAERGQAVAHVRPLAEAVGELRDQPHAGRGERMAAGDRAAVRVEPLVLGSDAQPVAPASAPAPRTARSARRGRRRRASGRPARAPCFVAGTGPRPISSRLDAGERVARRAACVGSRPSSSAAPARRRAGRRSRRRSARPSCRPSRGRRRGTASAASASASSVVSGRRNSSRSAARQPSSVKTVIGTTVSRMTPFSQAAAARCCERTAKRVGVVLRQLREAVVQVLGGRAHRHGRGVDEPLGDEARVEVDVLAHRVVAHVLDAAGEDDVGRAHRDLAGARGDRGERAGAHAVDREARHASAGCRRAARRRGRASGPGRRPARSRRRRRRRSARAAAVGLRRSSSRTTLTPMSSARVRQKTPFGPARPNARADAVDEEDLPQLAHVKTLVNRHTLATLP